MKTLLALVAVAVLFLTDSVSAQTIVPIGQVSVPSMPTVFTNASTNVLASQSIVQVYQVKSFELWISANAITNASAAGTTHVFYATSPDSTTWSKRDTNAMLDVVASGTSTVVAHKKVDCSSGQYFKLLQVENTDTNLLTNILSSIYPQ